MWTIPLLVQLLLTIEEVIFIFNIILPLVFNLKEDNILKINSTIFEDNYSSEGSIIYANYNNYITLLINNQFLNNKAKYGGFCIDLSLLFL